MTSSTSMDAASPRGLEVAARLAAGPEGAPAARPQHTGGAMEGKSAAPPGRAPRTLGSLCSGYEGLGMAIDAVLPVELAWVADNDPGAAKILAHHWPDVPNLQDIRAVDWTTVQPVDVLAAGFPCQSVSTAGRRAGLVADAASGLWSHVAVAIAALRPPLVVIENVGGLRSARAASDVEPCPWCLGECGDQPYLRALGAVLADLATLGFDAQWTSLPASEVGAAHERDRVFILAWPAAAHPAHLRHQRDRHPRHRRPGPAHGGIAAAHTPGDRRDQGRPQPTRLGGGPDAALSGAAIADPGGPRRQEPRQPEPGGRPLAPASPPADAEGDPGRLDHRDHHAAQWGRYAPAIARWERTLGRPAPDPTEPAPRGGRRLSPAFVEWLMGLPAGWVTSVPGLTRTQMLTALGNGVVPQQAAAALAWLLEHLEVSAA